jgi:glyoxylase-like metal-dependent hydrolase (beta-lactamase superfamily II)
MMLKIKIGPNTKAVLIDKTPSYENYKIPALVPVFEKDGFKLLIDPGTFSFVEGFIEAGEFNDVDAVIITHIHPDHLDKDNLAKIVELSGAKVYTVNK